MTQEISQIWVYLSASPLLGLTITLLAYQAAFALYSRSGNNPLANPVLIAVFILVLFLTLTATSYETYFSGAQFVHFLLGPATVALAIPLYTQFRRVRSMLLPVLAGLIALCATLQLAVVRRAPYRMQLVQLEGQNFLDTLRSKLAWGLDIRSSRPGFQAG